MAKTPQVRHLCAARRTAKEAWFQSLCAVGALPTLSVAAAGTAVVLQHPLLCLHGRNIGIELLIYQSRYLAHR